LSSSNGRAPWKHRRRGQIREKDTRMAHGEEKVEKTVCTYNNRSILSEKKAFI